jgi:dCMP deaminase
MNRKSLLKWDRQFLALATHISRWSKDPSTKVGAVIVDSKRRVLGIGYNGFPRGVNDDTVRYYNKETKHALVVHAEANAILNSHDSLEGSTIYIWPTFYTDMPPTCNECAKLIIQTGISRVVGSRIGARGHLNIGEKWAQAMGLANIMYKEAGVEVSYVT